MFRVVLIALLLVLALGGAGCGGPDTATPTESPLATPATTVLDSPVPTPEVAFVPTPLPEPGEGLGSVTGRLIDRETGDTITGLAVYLASIGPNTIMIQQNSSPHVIPDAEGYFALLDVEPKEYAIVLWTPHNSLVVTTPDDESTFVLQVEAGKITDVGELLVQRP